MNLRDLEYVEALGEHLNFSKAATACNVSQPALSNQIKKLEAELGASLFIRKLNEIEPTDLGKRVIQSASSLLKEAQNIRDMATEYCDPAALPLKVGMIPSIAPYLTNYLYNMVSNAMPEMQLAISEGHACELTSKVLQREIDIALIPKAFDSGQTDFTPLFSEAMYLAVSKNHHLATSKCIDYDEIPLSKLIFQNAPIGFTVEESYRRSHANAESMVGIDLSDASKETVCNYVSETKYCTILPEMAVHHMRAYSSKLSFVPIKNDSFIRDIGVISRIACPRKPILEALVQSINTAPPKGVHIREATESNTFLKVAAE